MKRLHRFINEWAAQLNICGGFRRVLMLLLAAPVPGCRRDVLMTASAAPGNYWMTVQPQYRIGLPAGYGVMRYNSSAAGLPSTPAPQPGTVKRWDTNFTMSPNVGTPLTLHPLVMHYTTVHVMLKRSIPTALRLVCHARSQGVLKQGCSY
jgi:hypothetical protein